MKEQELVSVEVVAEKVDLSARQVQSLASERVIPKHSRGKYDLDACVVSYIKYLRSRQQSSFRNDEVDYSDRKR